MDVIGKLTHGRLRAGAPLPHMKFFTLLSKGPSTFTQPTISILVPIWLFAQIYEVDI